jgi:hypothetical protein
MVCFSLARQPLPVVGRVVMLGLRVVGIGPTPTAAAAAPRAAV